MEETQKTGLRRVLVPIIVILVIVVGALLAVKASIKKEAGINSQLVELTEGKDVPEFELVKLDGTKVALSDLKHKVMMINFWATWCEACVEEMPSIVNLREKYASKGFEVLGVDVDENPQEAVPPMAKKFGMNFPIFTDKQGMLSELFDVHAIPLTVIINHDKKVLFVESGERDWNSVEIQQLLEKWLSE